MNPDGVAFISALAALAGFVAIWVRVGIYKGQSDSRLEEVERRTVALEKKIDSLQSDVRKFEIEVVQGISKLQTTVEFVLKGLDELKGAQGRPRGKDGCADA